MASLRDRIAATLHLEIRVVNDFAIDDLTLLDETPQLSKAFSPAVVSSGAISTLTFTITNTSGATITGPIQLLLTNLPAGVTGSNNNGTFNGSPYWNVPNSGSLAAGASVQATVQLNYPTTTAVSTSPALYTGSL